MSETATTDTQATRLAINNNQISFRVYGDDLENVQRVYAAISEKTPGLNIAAFFKTVMKALAEQLATGSTTLHVTVPAATGNDTDAEALRKRIQLLEGQLRAARQSMPADQTKLVQSLQNSLAQADRKIAQLEQHTKTPAEVNWEELPFLRKLIRVKENMKASMKRNQEAGHSTDFESYVVFMFEFCKNRISKRHF